ncbi:cytoplasmic polyadenylation element-binding protein 3-like protein, partial [Dinothrombium tinctorium]
MSDFGYTGTAVAAIPRKVPSPVSDQYGREALYFQGSSPGREGDTPPVLPEETAEKCTPANSSQSKPLTSVGCSQQSQSQEMRSIHAPNGCISDVNLNVDEFKSRKVLAKGEECAANEKQIGDLSECSNGSLVSGTITTGNCVQITQTQQNQAQLATPSHQLNVDQNQTSVSSCISNTPSSSYWSTTSSSDSETPFFQAVNVSSVVNGGLSFQNYTNSNSIQMNIPQQHSAAATSQRRAITGAHNFPQAGSALRQPQTPQPSAVQSSSLFKSYSSSAWNAPQSTTTWSSTGSQQAQNVNPWSTLNISNQKRTVGVVPNLAPISPLKKSPPAIGQSSMMISPSKFRRSTSMPLGKPFPSNIGHGNNAFEMSSLANDSQSSSSDTSSIRDSNVILPFQDRTLGGMGSGTANPLDTLRFPLEQQLLEIMRSATGDNQDHYK